MSATYPVFLGAVTIDSSNNRLRFTEGATTGNADVAAGTYFLRGDGSSDDYCLALKTALEAANASANTYTVTPSFSISASSACATVTVARATGSDTFALLWGDASTTLSAGSFGFAASDTANDASSKASTLTPTCVWVSSEPAEFSDPVFQNTARVRRMVGGQIRTFRRGGKYKVRDVGFAFVDPKRVLEDSISADTDRAFESFWELHSDGRRLEYHEASISSGSTLTSPTSSSRIGTAWHFDEEASEELFPRRFEPGLEIYSWRIRLLGYTA